MIKNKFLLGQKILAIIILPTLFSLTTLSQEKKLTKEVEETDNISINKDYWKTFESLKDKNKKKHHQFIFTYRNNFFKNPRQSF